MFKVLIVEDSDIVRKDILRLKAWGEASGFSVAHDVRDGMEAIKILENHRIDLIISDIRMPRLDGIDMLRIIKERGLCQFVVLLSEFAEFTYARQGIVLGAFDFLTKPLNEEDLSDLLNRVSQQIVCDRQKADRIKKLEEKIAETVLVYYPSLYIKQIVDLINSGNKNVRDISNTMINTTASTLNNDIIKIFAMIKNVANEIIDSVFGSNPWMIFFIDANVLKKAFSESYDLQVLKEEVYKIIAGMAELMNKLKCNGSNDPEVKKICDFILYNTGKKISVQSIAKRFYINKGYLGILFKQKTGKSLLVYINTVKMERAKKLLGDKDHLKIYEIAELLDFKSSEYFSKMFKEYTGETPRQYRTGLSE